MADYPVVFIDPFEAVTYDELDIVVLDESNGMFIEVAQEGADPGDTTLPEVTNYSPSAGTDIDADQAITFDVTDDSGLFRRIMVVGEFPDGSSEVIHDGDQFTTSYSATSSRSQITNGYRYTVLRFRGWPADVTIRVFAIDQAGNEAV